jgi:hypothetical protein
MDTFHVKYTQIFEDLSEILTLPQISSNTKFHENPFYGSRIVPYGETGDRTKGRTERCDEADSQVSQFCESACPGVSE